MSAPHKFEVGQRVRVRALDVFGIVEAANPPKPIFGDQNNYQVCCEDPMPGFIWLGAEDQLEHPDQRSWTAFLNNLTMEDLDRIFDA